MHGLFEMSLVKSAVLLDTGCVGDWVGSTDRLQIVFPRRSAYTEKGESAGRGWSVASILHVNHHAHQTHYRYFLLHVSTVKADLAKVPANRVHSFH